MREEPTAAEILGGVADFLEGEVMPTLSGRLAFHTRVAVNALAIVRREITLGPPAQAAEQARLSQLMARDGDLETLNDALCAAIAAGEIRADDPALIDHLWATTLDTMAIDQPNYETYRRVTAGQAPSVDP